MGLMPNIALRTPSWRRVASLDTAAIEGFSFIEDPTLRGLLVGTVLSFILLNVALVGLLFVYEVARILFLGVHETFGTGAFG